MPKYRLHATFFMGNSRRRAGEVVEFDGAPGSNMEPLDDEAWAAHHAHVALREKHKLPKWTRLPYTVKPSSNPPKPPAEIPDDWRETVKGVKLCRLALQLGAPVGTNAEQAIEFIEAEESRRKFG